MKDFRCTANPKVKYSRGMPNGSGLLFWAYDKNKEVWLTPERFSQKTELAKLSRQKVYRNPEKLARLRSSVRKYMEKLAQNPEYKEKKRMASIEWRKKNKFRGQLACQLWRQKNHAYVLSNNAKRRAFLRGTKKKLTLVEKRVCAGFYRDAKRLTEWWGIPWHVDHIVPISKGGNHHPSNLQLMPAIANLKKGTKV